MATVKNGATRGHDFDGKHAGLYLFVRTKVPHETFEVRLGVDWFGVRTIAAIQIQDLLHHPVESMRVFLNDRQQALIFRPTFAFFMQQVRGVVNARKRIADLVRNARREPSQCDQFHLLRLRPDATGVFDKNHRGRGRLVTNRDKPYLIIALGTRIAQHREYALRIVAPLG